MNWELKKGPLLFITSDIPSWNDVMNQVDLTFCSHI